MQPVGAYLIIHSDANVVISRIDLDHLSHENKEFVKKEAVGIVKHTLELNYDYWGVGNCQAWCYGPGCVQLRE